MFPLLTLVFARCRGIEQSRRIFSSNFTTAPQTAMPNGGGILLGLIALFPLLSAQSLSPPASDAQALGGGTIDPFPPSEPKVPRRTPAERTACTRGLICDVQKPQLDFFVIGDTGGIEINPGWNRFSYYRATPIQQRVAVAMSKMAAKIPLDFVLNVGDNVYYNGVDNVNDPRFKVVFETPYNYSSLEVPWYMIAGNHDHLGNIKAQIEYTQKSSKWTYPSLYYPLNYAFQDGRVDILMIDTVVLCGNCIDVQSRSIFSWMRAIQKTPERPDKEYVEEAKKQWKWLEEQMQRSTAEYLFVVGHYPIFSVQNPKLVCLYDKLNPLLKKYGASLYIAGHDHTVQYFRSNTTDGSPDSMRYLVSGAGSRTYSFGAFTGNDEVSLQYRFPPRTKLPFIKFATHVRNRNEIGFGDGAYVHINTNRERAELLFYAHDNKLEHRETIKPRRFGGRKS